MRMLTDRPGTTYLVRTPSHPLCWLDRSRGVHSVPMNHTTVTAITTFSDVFDMPRHAVHTYHIPRHDIRNHPQRPLLRARRYRWLDPYLVTHSKRAVVATLNLHKVDVKRYTPTVAIWRNAKGRSPPSTDNDWRHSESHLQQPDANSHRRQDFPAPQGFPPASQDRSAGKPRTLPAHALLAPVSDFSESVEQDKESGQRLDGILTCRGLLPPLQPLLSPPPELFLEADQLTGHVESILVDCSLKIPPHSTAATMRMLTDRPGTTYLGPSAKSTVESSENISSKDEDPTSPSNVEIPPMDAAAQIEEELDLDLDDLKIDESIDPADVNIDDLLSDD
ncbi:hypothetical protein GQR58_013198 [Nymphon striatum]|nr:hypothetical protein GQR58_013198 [Nymphon striatum]